MRQLFLALAFAVMALTCGCTKYTIDEVSIVDPRYWTSHVWKFAKQCHNFRVDIDRTIFDLDDRPVEDMDEK